MSNYHIDDVGAFQVHHTEKSYPKENEQYATSSYQKQHKMFPSLIVRPNRTAALNEDDISKTVIYARDSQLAIAVKSGGHQYSGASSTNGPNIQIDLTDAFKECDELPQSDSVPDDRSWVLIGVSVTMAELNKSLQAKRLFVPTGQCAYVGVGGHGQTGGYGQLGRSFGLFGDCIRAIHLIDYDGKKQEVNKESDPELFYAILGGSPGNFGVITHYIVEVFKGNSYLGDTSDPNVYNGPHGIKAYFLYSHDILLDALNLVAEMADDPTFPRGFDLCVSAYSSDKDTAKKFNLTKEQVAGEDAKKKAEEVYKDHPQYRKELEKRQERPPAVIIYAQWCPTSKDEKYDANVDKWFQKFRDLKTKYETTTLTFAQFPQDYPIKNMADLTGQWLMLTKREFDLPYVKRTYTTNSTSLSQARWAQTVADSTDLLFNPQHMSSQLFEGCKAVLQIQCFGGNNSMFNVNKDNGTSYSWRDSTVVQTMDCFYNPGYKTFARAWQSWNDVLMNGRDSFFSKRDRRVLWGSWGDWNMSDEKVWRTYYETEEKYLRLGKARAKADPNGTFTANPFAVQAFVDPEEAVDDSNQ